MRKQFVTKEISTVLRELGYKEPCIAIENDDNSCFTSGSTYCFHSDHEYYQYSLPLWQEVIEWFETTHKMWITLDPSIICFYNDKGELLPLKFQFCIEDLTDRTLDYLHHSADENQFFETSYEAREKAILKAIEICKIRQSQNL